MSIYFGTYLLNFTLWRTQVRRRNIFHNMYALRIFSISYICNLSKYTDDLCMVNTELFSRRYQGTVSDLWVLLKIDTHHNVCNYFLCREEKNMNILCCELLCNIIIQYLSNFFTPRNVVPGDKKKK